MKGAWQGFAPNLDQALAATPLLVVAHGRVNLTTPFSMGMRINLWRFALGIRRNPSRGSRVEVSEFML
jgi:hypothetical protein